VKIRIFQSPDKASRALARDIVRAVSHTPRLVLGLPTGRTSIQLYREIVRLSQSEDIDFSRATTFNLDEFLGLASDDPRSYHAFMRRHLFDHVNFSPRRTHLLNGAARDAAAECARFERAIARAGGIDLMILGLGRNGHIGFNEPGRLLVTPTHRTHLSVSTRRANAFLFDHTIARVPREALSMGMGTILRARRIVLLVTGRSKARAVERVLSGRLTTRVPASFLQLHRDVEVWLDEEASSLMSSN
jgi:glucosamine-6-phosphate deaminase